MPQDRKPTNPPAGPFSQGAGSRDRPVCSVFDASIRYLSLLLLLLLPAGMATAREDKPPLRIVEQRLVRADAAHVWELLQDFCSPQGWNPAVEATQCRGDGRPGTLRVLNLASGGMSPQKLIQRSPLHHLLAWRGAADEAGKDDALATLLARPDYHARIEVLSAGVDRSRILWVGTLLASGKKQLDQARVELLRRYWSQALDHLVALTDRTGVPSGLIEHNR
ncbi:MAG: SRPBCC family protein [Gammaproteobacteria bacterium]|nr:MAG: SRPBCC family protein [Gammaproteobacteria bacterium]